MSSDRPIRVGAVSYLNTKPLIHDFERLVPQARLVLDYPSRLATALATGDLDVALIPSIEFFQDPSYTIVSNACIACRGPVLSVKLFSRVPPAEIRTLALDEGSRTSVALTRILLKQRFDIEPKLERLDVDKTLADTKADAVLLIGDRAIHSPGGKFAEVWDLGDEWCRWAERPFVFAMWTARAGVDLCGIETALEQCRDAGLAALPEIARREAPLLGLTQPECLAYLRDNLYFYLGPQERSGLAMFHRLAQQMNLAPPGVDVGSFHLEGA
ncbi:MAG: menaquinone biosynthesis protein [Planctomycetales bacterium]|nr:menaquinone biosynthesis protein [Planctomycetales bacterium]MBN8626723.1 menaquinone biosynthesis protein [Planctomycetota bacterium]